MTDLPIKKAVKWVRWDNYDRLWAVEDLGVIVERAVTAAKGMRRTKFTQSQIHSFLVTSK